MFYKHLIPYNVVFSLLTIYIATIQADNPEAEVVPVTRVQLSSLWQASIDICQDPVSGSSNLHPNAARDVNSADWTEFKAKMEIFRHDLRVQHRRFERRICRKTVEMLRNFTIHDFIGIHSTLGENQDLAANVYQEISTMTYIFSILHSDGAKKCCLQNENVYLKLKNRVLPEIHNMALQSIVEWIHQHQGCTTRLTAMLHNQLTCEEVQNLILLVYKYVMHRSGLIIEQI